MLRLIHLINIIRSVQQDFSPFLNNTSLSLSPSSFPPSLLLPLCSEMSVALGPCGRGSRRPATSRARHSVASLALPESPPAEIYSALSLWPVR